ncbi:CYFA0S01e11716g1_1 [Cyberlindnera fabianii]|uniref:CYFA0S01e11716g1_1 n=1 Tax=Cyberlindnera fabianii TaxID=36022 RepID=A0A061AJ33_CYBFA|nr:CYFA0S01e11716g1_1 [Cyberlindnera fabianii]
MSEENVIKVTIKSSSDGKYDISVATSATVAELKELVAAESGVPAASQRLIYSGRVLKDAETVESYKVKDGNTIHMVKSAAARQTSAAPAASSESASTSTPTSAAASTPSTASQVPSNIATGQGTFNPLADLTGARYAGYANLPSASMFGPDGGMQLPNPEDMERMMENPMVQQSLNEMLRNPQMLDFMIQQSPQLRAMGPRARELLQSDMFRNMMTNPQMLRQMRQMQSMMGGVDPMGGSGASAFPAPGDATATNESSTTDNTSTNESASGANAFDANPFAAMFPGGNPMAGFGAQAGANQGSDSARGTPQLPGFDPAMMQAMMNSMGGGGFGGFGGAPAAEDNRPPEERYESQLRQLNDMGFNDFDSNVRALRRSGGSVQGAVESLLNGI